MGRVPLHRLDQVGDQVDPPLQLHVDLRPGVLDPVALLDEAVVDADRDQHDDHDEDEDDPEGDHDGVPPWATPAVPGRTPRRCRCHGADHRAAGRRRSERSQSPVASSPRRSRRSGSPAPAIENSSARAAAVAQAGGELLVGEHAAQRVGERRGIAGRHHQAVDTRPGDPQVAGELGGDDRRVGRHRLEQHDPERLAAQRRGAEHRGTLQAGDLLVVGDAPEPLDPAIAGELVLQSLGLGAVGGHPAARRRRGARPAPASRTSRPLRSSWRPQKKIVGPSLFSGSAAAIGLELDAVEHHRVVAAQVAVGELLRVGGHHAAHLDAAGQPAHDAVQHPVRAAVAGGVERAHDRRRVEQHGGLRRPRGQRLVQVEDVEVLVAKGADGAQHGRRIRRDRSDRPVGGGRDAVAERRHVRRRRRAVAGGQHPRLVSHRPQHPCQPEHLRLHAARDGHAVRAHQPDAQGASLDGPRRAT